MPYLEKKKIGKEIYLYLVKNVRINGNFKKFRIYIGKGDISKEQLQRLKSKYSKILDERIKAYLISQDPLLKLLSNRQIKDLEDVKKLYKKSYARLPKEVKTKHYEDFLIRFTYDTNAIEGSTVTLNETKLILLDKITPPNRTLREVREIENHEKAFSYVFNYKKDITKNFILKIHGILTNGVLPEDRSGKFRKVQVIITGVEIIPPKPEFVKKDIEQLIKWYNKHKRKYHPIVLTSYFHTAFEGVHPFVDFNGRTGRLLLNFILMKNGYPIIDVKYKDRLKYYESLQSAQKSNLRSFVNLVAKYIKEELIRVNNTYEMMRAPERFINHSCNPNSISKGRSAFALRNIRKGEEITADYRINAFDRNKWRCYCGSKNCKGWCISDFFTIPEKLQKKYLPYTIKVIREEYKKRHKEKLIK